MKQKNVAKERSVDDRLVGKRCLKKLIILLAVSPLLFSCATTGEQAIMDFWLNRSKAELIREWGSPTSISSYGHGVEVLSYNRYRTYSIPAFGQPSTQVSNNFNQFYVGSDGTICYVR